MKILFICRYNNFRSKTAEAFFRKFNKDLRLKAESAGVINHPLNLPNINKAAKKFGIRIGKKTKLATKNLLKEVDLAIIVADDLPENFLSRDQTGQKGRSLEDKRCRQGNDKG